MSAPIKSQKDVIFDVNQKQREASNPSHSVWVSASAGSGKTKVLSDRIIRLLLAGVAPQKILCLTFTKAAAAEMSIRLTQRLSQWAVCDEAELEKELDNLQGHAIEEGQRERARRLFAQILSCPGGMRIQTIHSFAQEILGRFPLESGLPPHFTVLEETEAYALREEVMQDFLQDIARGKDPELSAALNTLVASLGEERFNSHLNEVINQPEKWDELFQREDGFDEVCARIAEKLDVDPNENIEKLILKTCDDNVIDREALISAGRVMASKGSPTIQAKGRVLLDWLALDLDSRASLINEYKLVFLTTKDEPRKSIVNKKLSESVPGLEELLQTEVARLASFVAKHETLQIYQEGVALMRLGLRVMKAYAARKGERAALDYDDLILRTKELLQRPDIAPWVLFKLDGGVDHILLDEAQDTNPAQWDIVTGLVDEFFAGSLTYDGRTLFVVGDEKQSIYSFLKADPAEFERRRHYFMDKVASCGMELRQTPLHVSFRSAPAVLQAVDEVFAPADVQQGVSQAPIKHHAFRDQASGRVELWDLVEAEKQSRKSVVAEWQLPTAYENVTAPAVKLADDLAVRVKEWIAQGQAIYDSDIKAMRSMQARDVMILVRSRKGIADHLVRAFKHHRVPISGVDKMLLGSQLAVMDLMALMQFTLLPQDDLNLACVLRGPLCGATEDELEQLAVGRDATLWQSLLQYAARNERFAAWCDYLKMMSTLADRCDPLALLVQILTQSCPADPRGGRRALIARLGPQAEDPIDELLNQAENFVAQKNPSLQAFLHELSANEVEIKRELEANMDCVRITTVHGAKGLEAPIVILPDTVSAPARSMLPKILWDEASGLPFYVPREPKHEKLIALREAAREAQLEEYRRLLYVALTRAADRLIICGYESRNNSTDVKSWYQLVEEGLAQHRIEEPEDDVAIVLSDYAAPETADKEPEAIQQDVLPLPIWLFTPPSAEPTPPRPLVPSLPSQEEQDSESSFAAPQDARFARGRIIHKLLQNLPDLPEPERAVAASRFLASPQHSLDQAQQDEIAHEVLGLLDNPDFAPLFGPQSKAELPIIGLSGERLISGQVDRLALVEDEVWIVDYKTNRPPPTDVTGVPAIYRSQMEAYRTVLQAIYPDQEIRCFLLWTYVLSLMEIK